MKAEELRIGNLVLNKHGELHEIGYNCFQRFRHPTMDGNPSGFKPIPLTEEWLLKFGFKVTIEHTWSFGYDKEFKVFTMDGFTYNSLQAAWWYHRLLDNQPQYVHQLQNLYFALTGSELTIKEDKTV